MVIGDLLRAAAKRLDNNGTGDSYNEALVLLTIAMNCSKTYIYLNKNTAVGEDIAEKYKGYIERRANGEPVAYIAGTAWFMSLEFNVGPAVLIPRHETEGLVEKASVIIQNEYPDKADVLDMCTGSGCIGISTAAVFDHVIVHLSDVDDDALKIAVSNIQKHNLGKRVTAMKSDLFENLAGNKYDLILSNPPYVAEDDEGYLDDEVRRYEPPIALFGGKDGLYFYKRIAEEAGSYLNPGGYLILEAGIGQAESIKRILIRNNFTLIDIQEDISGIPRIITAKK
ncbi:MAG: peptide chain release factor N(5)-glutamine methyltransferase [Clostridia bacterium]|nr:peptide chain release factor N(5)-glutamine methyltransferase [Clostridia bacterium]MBN2883087.1 peptide chain release factor N(5)-glutamine methyltransferase [Clostridia bacterium]